MVANHGERSSSSATFTQVDGRHNLLFSVPRKAPVQGTDAAEGDRMPDSRCIARWLAITGVALMLQGCWDDEQLTLLGEGGCRSADGSEGNPTYVSGVSIDQCQSKCFNGQANCTAVEYNTNNGQCEVHSDPIIKHEEVAGVFCYRRN